MTALALVGGMNVALAQTDVTSTYITNADFSQGTPVTVGVCTYVADKSTNGTNYANLVDVDGWTSVDSKDGKAGGLFAIGGGAWLGGKGYTAPATDSDGNTGVNVLGIVTCWSASVQYTQQLKAALPAGTYTLVLAAYNSGAGQNDVASNLIGFVPSSGTATYATTKKYTSNTWKYEFITFTLNSETTGSISLGYKSTNTGSGNMPHLFISGLELYEGSVNAEEYEAAKALKRKKGEWTVALQNANDALTNYAYVVGDERDELAAEVEKAEPTTLEGYEAAISALTNKLSAFNGAKASFDALETAKAAVTPDLAYAAAAKKTDLTNAKAVTATSKADAEEKTAAITQALRAYYESHALAEGVEGALNMTDRIANPDATDGNNSWTLTGKMNNPASNEPWTDSDGNNEHFYFDGGNWSGTNWTTTMKQTISIPAGRYLLTAKGRAATNTTLTMAVGEASVELPNIGSTGNVFDRGWGDGSVEFETDGSDAEIVVTASAAPTHEWFSISQFRLVRLELFTEMATAEDYEAMNTALAAAENMVLGFAEGEYAPYNNVEAIKAIATAKAIDTSAENAKADIDAITTALGKWTANAGDVDAIYDGDLANAPIQATSENVVLPGWVTKSGNTRQTFKGNDNDNGGKACLGADEVGLFVHPGTYNYGEATGYTMPLKANTWYVASAKYCAWANGSNNDFTLTILKEGTNFATKSYGANATACTVADALKEVKLYFKTSDAADYVFSVVANGNTFVTGFHITKAVAEEVTISEDETYTPEEKYANVTFNRTTVAGWNGMVVPFDVDESQMAAIKTLFNVKDDRIMNFSGITYDEDNGVTLNFTQATEIKAGRPFMVYLNNARESYATFIKINGRIIKENPVILSANSLEDVSFTAEGNDNIKYTFKGTYAASTDLTNVNFALIQGNQFYYHTAGKNSSSAKAFRAYFENESTEPNAARISFNFGDGDVTTAISEVKTTTPESDAIYNLGGQRVMKAQKGLYIQNGKKMVIK